MAQSAALKTVADYARARVTVISHCSSYPEEHSHRVDLTAADQNAEIDESWRTAQVCPVCGSPGGGLALRIG